MLFEISGVYTPIWLPPLVAFGISFFTSMGGVSGAFLLLPFQVSFLGYNTPSVSATNQLYNIVSIPSGVYRYIREGRMIWPLTWAVILGTLPGVVLGAWLRVEYLPEPETFKKFAGLVLLYIGFRLVLDVIKTRQHKQTGRKKDFPGLEGKMAVTQTKVSWKQIEFTFQERSYSFPPLTVFGLCLLVGLIGGIYGIGGGAIVAPFFVAFFGLPVHTVAGAALMGTFITSVAGVGTYQVLAVFYPDLSVSPDWMLGFLFGAGGLVGMYCGARVQKFVPALFIKILLCGCILFVAAKYLVLFFY